ncbi:unnamed protein product [Sphenostylis stenocarpa]|uniref:Cysteine proteinase inhibitor n=1 Tax=Sphenostylis stenocarpa TaxID=92480 RepID=A0AA86VRZ7_9FABA|nr:unnamed protein product [Sphenostylis stenocarpa]
MTFKAKSKNELLEFHVLISDGTTLTTGQIFDVPANTVEIENVARFAVDQYNKIGRANLVFVRAIHAKKQVVHGFNYFITLEAKDGDIIKVYETKVWAFSNSKELLEFHVLVRNDTTLTKTGQIFYVPADTKGGEITRKYGTKVWEFMNSEQLLKFHILVGNDTTLPKAGQIVDVPVNTVEIENVARFAVDQYNKNAHANLVFVRTIHAWKQVVKGFNYFINLLAKDGEIINLYETKVWEFSNSKELLEFKLVACKSCGHEGSDIAPQKCSIKVHEEKSCDTMRRETRYESD